MEKYTLDKDGILYKNDEMTICPKAAPFLAPQNTNIKKINEQDNLIETRLPCNNLCPFFQMTELVNNKVLPKKREEVIVLHCMEVKRIIRYENKN